MRTSLRRLRIGWFGIFLHWRYFCVRDREDSLQQAAHRLGRNIVLYFCVGDHEDFVAAGRGSVGARWVWRFWRRFLGAGLIGLFGGRLIGRWLCTRRRGQRVVYLAGATPQQTTHAHEHVTLPPFGGAIAHDEIRMLICSTSN